MRRFAALVVALVICSACTPPQLIRFADFFGIGLSSADAHAISGHLEAIATDCLPDYAGSDELECAIVESAKHHGIDVDTWATVAWCESAQGAYAPDGRRLLNLDDFNETSGASGPYQQLRKYWDGRSRAAGWPGADIFDEVANTWVSAWLWVEAPGGGPSHWDATRWCWG